MTKPRKYLYLFVVQRHCDAYGWEDCSESEDIAEERRNLREYRLSDPWASYRVIRRREINPARAARGAQ